jgi:hypothetical protein
MSYYSSSVLLFIYPLLPLINAFIHPCYNLSLTDRSLSYIHSWQFYSGHIQPANVTCSWLIHHSTESTSTTDFEGYYQLSLRSIEYDHDPTVWSNELQFHSANRSITLEDINQRSWIFLSSSPLEIIFRAKPPMTQSKTLNIHRFVLEWIYVDNNQTDFSCQQGDRWLPLQWQCNCQQECFDSQTSDELNCPLCSLLNLSTSLLCRSNEIWCLPTITNAYDGITDDRTIDSKGNQFNIHLTSKNDVSKQYR